MYYCTSVRYEIRSINLVRVPGRSSSEMAARAVIGRAVLRPLMSTVMRAAPAAEFARTVMLVTRRVAISSPMHSFSARAFSTSDLVIRQADQTAALITVAEKDILYNCEGHSWAHMDPEHVDKCVSAVGRCRDFVNSLSDAECKAAEAHNGVISRVDFVEGMLATAIKCDELCHEVHELRLEIEDVGTEGDGNNKPGAFTQAWSDKIDHIFDEYADMLDKCDSRYVQRLENELGYQLLLLKRIMHIDNFRYVFPRVHPSGFSTSAD